METYPTIMEPYLGGHRALPDNHGTLPWQSWRPTLAIMETYLAIMETYPDNHTYMQNTVNVLLNIINKETTKSKEAR
jgi:hypothetical protein